MKQSTKDMIYVILGIIAFIIIAGIAENNVLQGM